jgi:hypothetical protein
VTDPMTRVFGRGARWLTAMAAVTGAGVVAARVVRRVRDRAYRRGVAESRLASALAWAEAEHWHAMQTPQARAQIKRMEGMTRLSRKEQD